MSLEKTDNKNLDFIKILQFILVYFMVIFSGTAVILFVHILEHFIIKINEYIVLHHKFLLTFLF